jgi:hypothetical protein
MLTHYGLSTQKESVMSENFDTAEGQSAAPAQQATPKAPELTKEQKLAKIQKEIDRLKEKYFNVENAIVAVPKAKVVALPEIGTDVLFSYGRRTATTEPTQKIGKVTAVKPASTTAEGKKLPAQIKVSVGEGFEQEFVVIYPAQIVTSQTASE